jgi:hypothetical protein
MVLVPAPKCHPCVTQNYVKFSCVRNTRRRFWHKFQDVSYRNIIHATVNKLKQTRSLLNKKGTKSKHCVLTVEKMNEISARPPQKSFEWHA